MAGADVVQMVSALYKHGPAHLTHIKREFEQWADQHGYATVGEYEDGRPGELFLQVAKAGSTLAGIMDAFAISVSHGLQYGVPLEAFVDMFSNTRFEPAGMTDDPDLRFATSLVDYIFRRLAVEYLPLAKREALGVLTVGTYSLADSAAFPDATVWSSYGSGYGFVPLVLPVLGLLWLRKVTPARLR